MTFIPEARGSPPVAADERARPRRAATTKAPSRRCAPAAATTRSRRPSSRRSGSCRFAPHRVAKLSGIGCSSKTPAYFLREAHGFNGVHGRMPALATGANAANGDLIYIGVSGDGDSLSIGLGQLSPRHPPQREPALRAREQRRLRPDQGQFSAAADQRLDQQEGRGQHDGAHRRRAAGADARRHVRGAQLLGRQGAARADV